MSHRRLGVGVTVTGSCLYAVGGSDGTVPLASVERSVVRTETPALLTDLPTTVHGAW